jgi:hypothetical protein
VLLRVLTVGAAIAVVPLSAHAAPPVPAAPVVVPAATPDPTEPPPVTYNEFLPEDRNLSECISALPRPGCGSEARGGWRQGLVLLAILGGLAVIAWRVIVSSRRARLTTPRTPGATSAPDAPGGDPGP